VSKLRIEVLHPRESSDNPRLNAFCRVAPSLRLRLLAIFLAGVLLRAADFNSRTSALVQARLFEFLFAMYNSPNLKRALALAPAVTFDVAISELPRSALWTTRAGAETRPDDEWSGDALMV
jgi:hypothetical protein